MTFQSNVLIAPERTNPFRTARRRGVDRTDARVFRSRDGNDYVVITIRHYNSVIRVGRMNVPESVSNVVNYFSFVRAIWSKREETSPVARRSLNTAVARSQTAAAVQCTCVQVCAVSCPVPTTTVIPRPPSYACQVSSSSPPHHHHHHRAGALFKRRRQLQWLFSIFTCVHNTRRHTLYTTHASPPGRPPRRGGAPRTRVRLARGRTRWKKGWLEGRERGTRYRARIFVFTHTEIHAQYSYAYVR